MQLRWPWLLIIAALPLLGWWSTGLFDLDEGFYDVLIVDAAPTAIQTTQASSSCSA